MSRIPLDDDEPALRPDILYALPSWRTVVVCAIVMGWAAILSMTALSYLDYSLGL